MDGRLAFVWFTQMVASVSWIIACYIYDSYEHGDVWQWVSAAPRSHASSSARVATLWRPAEPPRPTGTLAAPACTTLPAFLRRAHEVLPAWLVFGGKREAVD